MTKFLSSHLVKMLVENFILNIKLGNNNESNN